jgi:hypothetical protein
MTKAFPRFDLAAQSFIIAAVSVRVVNYMAIQGTEQHPVRAGLRLTTGDAVIVVLHSPREKCWGVLDEINQAGIFMRGVDLNAFDDWVRSIKHDEPFFGFNDQFFPMWRVERLTRDESAGGIPSLAEQFALRTGRDIREV